MTWGQILWKQRLPFWSFFALGFAVGYGVRSQVSRNRRRHYAERNQL
jgi:hypothetical protein